MVTYTGLRSNRSSMNSFTSFERLSNIPSSSSKSKSPIVTFRNVSLSSSPIKGDNPLRRTYVMTPSGHMSAASVIGLNVITSGAVFTKEI